MDPKIKEEKEKEAVVIAGAFEQVELATFKHLATKKDLLVTEQRLEQRLEHLKSGVSPP